MKALAELAGRVGLKALEKFEANRPKREARQARRQAKRKARRGEPLTPEEEALVMSDKVTVIMPDGSKVERVEPTIKARTSTKMGSVGLVALLGTAGTLIPFYDEANALITQACESGNAPVAVLLGGAAMLALNWITARKTKSPIVPGKL